MIEAPKGVRLHVGLFGRANAGKSSLLNLIAGQDVSITSPVPGTTTDVVEKAMELLPIGPVLWLDTAGLGDRSELAGRRLERTRRALGRSDVVLLVLESEVWTPDEEEFCRQLRAAGRPLIIAVNKTDLRRPSPGYLESLRRRSPHVLSVCASDPSAREDFLTRLIPALQGAAGASASSPTLLGDLLPAKGLAVFVVPIDLEAPKGRLILPQVQCLRDALDAGAMALTVKETELKAALANLSRSPDLVVCDSQAVRQVVDDLPQGVPCTTFSIIMARAKGDLSELSRGARRIAELRGGDRVLVAEACTHHAVEGDIGRVKIPAWLRRNVGAELRIDVVSGHDWPQDLSAYRLIIHCGACTLNRREMLGRLERAKAAGVAITNYGVAIAALQGVAGRVLSPFPKALDEFGGAVTAGAGR
jgi:[FeFe] hydrogenase H-cluster maturation GTPase HydF